jgi:hypothetical protein
MANPTKTSADAETEAPDLKTLLETTILALQKLASAEAAKQAPADRVDTEYSCTSCYSNSC